MMPRLGRVRGAVPLMLIGAAALGAACGGGDAVEPGPAPPPPPPPPPPANRAPAAAAAIPDQTVVEGQTATVDLSASFSDPDGDALSHAAATSNSGVATVAVSGTELSVTGVARGAAAVTVTASDPGGLSASQSFAVEVAAPAPATMTVAPDTATLTAIGGTVRLAADVRDQIGRPLAGAAVVWSSGDAAVATVDTSGLVTAVGNGRATIAAVAAGISGEASDSASIVVSQTATAVEIAPPTRTLAAGDTVRLAATATDANGYAVAVDAFRWTSSDAAVASVDDMGLVRGIAGGTATVTAAGTGAAAGLEGTAEITVLPPDPPPDLGGTYYLESIAGVSTGGTRLTRPAVSGTLKLTQEAPSADSARGRYEVGITTPTLTIADEGAFTVRADGGWRQTGQASGEGSYAVSGDTLTLAIVRPETAASTTVWVMGEAPAAGTWRGLVVAPEVRCSEYEVDDYRHLDSLEDAVAAALGGKLYEAYTGVYYDHARDVQVDHIVAKEEAHDSGACRWTLSKRRNFVRDLENLALATPRLDLGVKAGRDAAEWMPDFNRCWYAGAVVAVRRKYELTVDEAERDALEGVLAGCDSTELVLTAESWTVESITLGDESGWQALSPREPDFGGRGVASYVAVFCTSAYASVDFAFALGGARLTGSFEDYESGRLGYTSRIGVEWSAPPPRPLDRMTVHQYPHWETWTARAGVAPRDAFIGGLVLDGQRVLVTWPLREDVAIVTYGGGADAREKILDVLRRCTGREGDAASLLSGLARNPTALRERP